MLNLSTARILVISQTEADRDKMKKFIARMPFDSLTERDFVIGREVPVDDYDFAIFDATGLPPVTAKTELKEADALHLELFRKYLHKPIKYILYYGEYLYDLDRERCPSANSKFSLFARVKELIDFINHYRE